MDNTVNVLLIYSAKKDLEVLVTGCMAVKEYINVYCMCVWLLFIRWMNKWDYTSPTVVVNLFQSPLSGGELSAVFNMDISYLSFIPHPSLI